MTNHPFTPSCYCTYCVIAAYNKGLMTLAEAQQHIMPAVPATPAQYPQYVRKQISPPAYTSAPLAPPYLHKALDEWNQEEALEAHKEPAPGFIGMRGTYKVEHLGWDWHNDEDTEKGYREEVEYKDANLVGSKVELEEDGHLPCIDLDLPAHLEPSTKPDHYHLYINKVVSWDKYLNLLKAMYEAGLVNEGFYKMTEKRGQSFVRRPGVFKQPGEDSS